ncbi:MAG: 2-nitropropane dioxygenase [Anaerolineaceae bacterium]|nr:2-nitropropane dioxygenase [Anaerolineaceae bacterium]
MVHIDLQKPKCKPIEFSGLTSFSGLPWYGKSDQLTNTPETIRAKLDQLSTPLWVVRLGGQIFITGDPGFSSDNSEIEAERLAYLPAVPANALGDEAFKQTYGVKYAYYSGAMANAIASVEMVITLGKNGMMGSYGSAGMPIDRIKTAIQDIQSALPNGPYAVNLIHTPFEPGLELKLVELYLEYGVPVLEASAYMDMSYSLVYYRAAGLSLGEDGQVKIKNRIIAKVSRKEVASRFMNPAPQEYLDQLMMDGKITPLQAELAKTVPVADDITVEADSGGHTDNRPLVGLIPTMIALRDRIQAERQYTVPVRVGAGGGISTPASALAAFEMGAAYVVTGSINQACVESGASEHTRKLLAQADMADVIMAPAADMFEMGVKVQVLKRGTMFAMRASKLYEIYSRYENIETIPAADREKIEKTIFRRNLDDVWADTAEFFKQRDPKQLVRAEEDGHYKMALIFRWYLGLSSRWSVVGEAGREMDFQIWCGPSMGSFNEWVQGTYLEKPENRYVVDVILQILNGAAYLKRVNLLQSQGVQLSSEIVKVYPTKVFIE